MNQRAYVGLGSNIEPAENIDRCQQALDQTFENVRHSPIYRCPAEGFVGDDFFNAVSSFDTELDPDALSIRLKKLESDLGRTREEERFSDRLIDIDLLMVGQMAGQFDGFELPRADVTRYAFVLKPLRDLEPALIHPVTGQTMQTHWLAMVDSGKVGVLSEL